MPHPTLHAALAAEFNRQDGLLVPADYIPLTEQAQALATAAVRAITEHMGGEWFIIRVGTDAVIRQEIFADLTHYHDDERNYRGHIVTVVSDGVDGPYLSVDGWVISPRRKVVDVRDTLGMIRDLDLLIDVLDETAATR